MKPTVGRNLWYVPSAKDAMAVNIEDGEPQPLHASVVATFGGKSVNLVVFDAAGSMFKVTGVKVVGEGDSKPGSGGYAMWPKMVKPVAETPPIIPPDEVPDPVVAV